MQEELLKRIEDLEQNQEFLLKEVSELKTKLEFLEVKMPEKIRKPQLTAVSKPQKKKFNMATSEEGFVKIILNKMGILFVTIALVILYSSAFISLDSVVFRVGSSSIIGLLLIIIGKRVEGKYSNIFSDAFISIAIALELIASVVLTIYLKDYVSTLGLLLIPILLITYAWSLCVNYVIIRNFKRVSTHVLSLVSVSTATIYFTYLFGQEDFYALSVLVSVTSMIYISWLSSKNPDSDFKANSLFLGLIYILIPNLFFDMNVNVTIISNLISYLIFMFVTNKLTNVETNINGKLFTMNVIWMTTMFAIDLYYSAVVIDYYVAFVPSLIFSILTIVNQLNTIKVENNENSYNIKDSKLSTLVLIPAALIPFVISSTLTGYVDDETQMFIIAMLYAVIPLLISVKLENIVYKASVFSNLIFSIILVAFLQSEFNLVVFVGLIFNLSSIMIMLNSDMKFLEPHKLLIMKIFTAKTQKTWEKTLLKKKNRKVINIPDEIRLLKSKYIVFLLIVLAIISSFWNTYEIDVIIPILGMIYLIAMYFYKIYSINRKTEYVENREYFKTIDIAVQIINNCLYFLSSTILIGLSTNEVSSLYYGNQFTSLYYIIQFTYLLMYIGITAFEHFKMSEKTLSLDRIVIISIARVFFTFTLVFMGEQVGGIYYNFLLLFTIITLLILGFLYNLKEVRITGLFLVFILAAKLLLIDSWNFSLYIKVASYGLFGVVLIGITYVYNKYLNKKN